LASSGRTTSKVAILTDPGGSVLLEIAVAERAVLVPVAILTDPGGSVLQP